MRTLGLRSSGDSSDSDRQHEQYDPAELGLLLNGNARKIQIVFDVTGAVTPTDRDSRGQTVIDTVRSGKMLLKRESRIYVNHLTREQ
jgi:hypothetical protein